jgi:hypothetical protein
MRLSDTRRTNGSVMIDFLAGIDRKNKRGTVQSVSDAFADGTPTHVLRVGNEDVAAHHVRMGFVVVKAVEGRNARKVRDQLVTTIDGHLRWSWI